jgi:hypothetical protein
MRACDAPEVRIYRIHWATLVDGEKDAVAQAVWLAKDRALLRRKLPVTGPPKLTIELRKGGGITLLGRDLGSGAGSLEELETALVEIRKQARTVRPLVRAGADVRFGIVVQAFDALRRAGYAIHGEAFLPRPRQIEFEIGPAPDGLKAAREAIAGKRYGRAVDLLARLFARKPADWPRVMELLLPDRLAGKALTEFKGMVHLRVEVMEELARAFMHADDPETLLRAYTLLGILIEHEARPAWSRDWWRWQSQRMRVCLYFGRNGRDRNALDQIVKLERTFRVLGVLERTPYRYEIDALARSAERMLADPEKR